MRDQTALAHSYIPVGRLWDPKTKQGNYDNNRVVIDRIIMHTMQGTTPGSTAHFKNPSTQASAHYGVSLNGDLTQWLYEKTVSYHAGSYGMNQRSIGIEHEDGYNPATRPNAYNEPRPDELYETSAKLVADICAFYQIPIDREHIKLHKEVSSEPKACPGSLDVDRIIKRALELNGKTEGEEALVSHMMKPSVFSALVTKATNWDDFCALVGVPPAEVSSFGMGKKLFEAIKSRLEQSAKPTSTPTTAPSVTPTPENPTGAPDSKPSAPPVEVPKTVQPPQTVQTDAENFWKTDVIDVLKGIFTLLKGRVTLK